MRPQEVPSTSEKDLWRGTVDYRLNIDGKTFSDLKKIEIFNSNFGRLALLVRQSPWLLNQLDHSDPSMEIDQKESIMLHSR